MNPLKALARIFTKGEGERITAPVAYVQYPQQGFIPMSWPLNFWQTGRDPLQGGAGGIVETCVWAYIAAMAQLPGFHRSTGDDGGTETYTTTALSRVLRYPNAYQTSSDFMVHLVRSLLLTGNSYWPVTRNARNEIAALHWTIPQQCRPLEVKIEGEAERAIFYRVGANPVYDFASLIGEAHVIPSRDVLHIKLATPRHPLIGETWLSAYAFDLGMRGALSLGMMTYFQNMSRPSGVLRTDLVLNKQQVDELRERWNEQAKGLNQGGVPILTAGLDFKPVSASAADAQIIEALKLSDQQVCGLFGVPPLIAGLGQGQPVKTTEAQMNDWLSARLGFLIGHIEAQFDQFNSLKGVIGEPGGEYVEYDTKALLRSLFRERIEGLVRGVQGGIYSPNEARAEEGKPAAKDGDEPRVQQQVVPLSFTGKKPPPALPPPAPPPAAEAEDELEEEATKALLAQIVSRSINEACHGAQTV